MARFYLVALLAILGLAWGASAAEKPKITLRYFNIRGLAEPIRLSLAAAGLDWDEVKYENCGKKCPEGIESWGHAKEKHSGELFPFGQVPSLSYHSAKENVDLVQSLAIQRFIGQRHGLYGSSPAEETMIDIVAGGAVDLRTRYSKLIYNKITDKLWRNYQNTDLPIWLLSFETLLEKSGTGFFVGKKLSFADIMVWDIVDHNLRINPQCLDHFDSLGKFYRHVAEIPNIKAYLESPKRRIHANGNSAFYDSEEIPAPVTRTYPPKVLPNHGEEL